MSLAETDQSVVSSANILQSIDGDIDTDTADTDGLHQSHETSTNGDQSEPAIGDTTHDQQVTATDSGPTHQEKPEQSMEQVSKEPVRGEKDVSKLFDNMSLGAKSKSAAETSERDSEAESVLARLSRAGEQVR